MPTKPSISCLSLVGVALCLGAAAPSVSDWAARRARVESLAPADRQQLARQQERFDSLTPEEQQQLRQFHDDLEADPNHERLRKVLGSYYNWLKTLGPGQRAELLDLPPAERVERIKKLRAEQTSRDFREWGVPPPLARR